jgi:hypothetical protein
MNPEFNPWYHKKKKERERKKEEAGREQVAHGFAEWGLATPHPQAWNSEIARHELDLPVSHEITLGNLIIYYHVLAPFTPFKC